MNMFLLWNEDANINVDSLTWTNMTSTVSSRRKRSETFLSRAVSEDGLFVAYAGCKTAAVIAVFLWAMPQVANSATTANSQAALATIQYFGATASVLYTAAASLPPDAAEGTKLQEVAAAAYKEIQTGKAASQFTAATADFTGSALAYASALDPEPLSRTVAAVASYGVHKTGEYAGQTILEQAQRKSLEIVKEGLQQSHYTAEQLSTMPKAKLQDTISELRVGNTTIRALLKDQPDILELVQANAVDFAQQEGAAALLQVQSNNASISVLKSDLVETAKDLSDYQQQTDTQLSQISAGLSELSAAASKVQSDITSIRAAASENAESTQVLAQISYQGWSPSQKLAALQSNMFPELGETEKSQAIDALQAQVRLQNAVGNLQNLSSDLTNVRQIANNLGVNPSVIDAVAKGQEVVEGLADFATGNYLGAIASVTGLVGMSKPDPEAARFAALYGYLGAHFSEIDRHLTEIENLQKQTIDQLAEVGKELSLIDAKLTKVDKDVLINGDMLRNLILAEWDQCDALMQGSLGGNRYIASNQQVLALSSSGLAISRLGRCYRTYVDYFDVTIRTGRLKGSMLDVGAFNDVPSPAQTDLQKNADALQARYESARLFYFEVDPLSFKHQAYNVARLADPSPDVATAAKRDAALSRNMSSLDALTCDEKALLNVSLIGLLCGAKTDGSPDAADWQRVLNSTAIGPQASAIIDYGIVVSQFIDLATVAQDGSVIFSSEHDLRAITNLGPSKSMRDGASQNKGLDILLRALILAQAQVVQQSATYGDVTAETVEEQLYDPNTNAFVTDRSKATAIQQHALDVMKGNPVVARNAVMLGIRRAITTSETGKQSVTQSTFYALAISAYKGSRACLEDPVAADKLQRLLPGWHFSIRGSQKDTSAGGALENCPVASPIGDYTEGVSVEFGDFYVKAPAPGIISAGIFEYPAGLSFAIGVRNKIIDQIVRLRIGRLVDSEETAISLLSSGCLSGKCH